MSMFETLFNNSNMKKQILKKFVNGYKEAGINRIVVSLDANDEILTEVINESKIIVEANDYNFLREFYFKHKSTVLKFEKTGYLHSNDYKKEI